MKKINSAYLYKIQAMKKGVGRVDIQRLIMASVSVGIVLIVWYLSRELITKLIERISLGMILILIVNIVVPTYSLGVNWLTVGCAGVLGVPGVITLYIINMVI